MSNNPWQLYDTVEGWEAASAALDDALKTALRNVHLARAEGKSKHAARQGYFREMEAALYAHSEWGADDSEGHQRLRYVFNSELGL